MLSRLHTRYGQALCSVADSYIGDVPMCEKEETQIPGSVWVKLRRGVVQPHLRKDMCNRNACTASPDVRKIQEYTMALLSP